MTCGNCGKPATYKNTIWNRYGSGSYIGVQEYQCSHCGCSAEFGSNIVTVWRNMAEPKERTDDTGLDRLYQLPLFG